MSALPRRLPALVLAVLLCAGLAPAAWALFTDTATVTAGSTPTTAFTAGSLGAPGTPTAAQADGASPVTVTWSAAAVSGGGTASTQGPAPSGYEVLRYADATGGTGTVACTTTSPTTTCSATAPATGTVYYAVRARFAAAWVRESGRVAYTDTRGPLVVVTRPVANQTLDSAALRSSVNAGCNPTGTTSAAVACGTVNDTAGLTQVEYQLQRSGLLAQPSCWNGSAFATGQCGTQFRPATLSSTSPGQATWRVPGSPTTAYVVSSLTATYTLTIRATDAGGRVTTSTTTFSTLL